MITTVNGKTATLSSWTIKYLLESTKHSVNICTKKERFSTQTTLKQTHSQTAKNCMLKKEDIKKRVRAIRKGTQKIRHVGFKRSNTSDQEIEETD